MQEITRDVVIIGAGPAGLTAARRLSQTGKTVAVLEARDRVGGRTWSDTIDGSFLEIGGQWIAPEQTAIQDLAAELGLELFQRHRDGDSVFIDKEGNRHRFTGDFPVKPETLEEMRKLRAELTRAAEYDEITFDAWLRAQSDDAEARLIIGNFISGAMLTKPKHSFSLLQAIFFGASAGSFENLVDEDILLDKRVVGGMQSVSIRIAEELGSENVFLDNPVRELHWEDTAEGAPATVTAITDHLRVSARHAILAVPPNLYSRIQYVPALPRIQQIAHQHHSMGLVIKVHASYDRPFWREQGLSGTGFGYYNVVQDIYDNTNHRDERGTLVGFIVEHDAEKVWALPEDERRETILNSLAEYLGDEARNPLAFYLSDFGAEEWTRGAYGTSYDLGGLSRWGATQNQPVGPIFFASSDIQGFGYQHVDGAVRIGQDTAARILEADRAAQ
jgi:putrescine oxidase